MKFEYYAVDAIVILGSLLAQEPLRELGAAHFSVLPYWIMGLSLLVIFFLTRRVAVEIASLGDGKAGKRGLDVFEYAGSFWSGMVLLGSIGQFFWITAFVAVVEKKIPNAPDLDVPAYAFILFLVAIMLALGFGGTYARHPNAAYEKFRRIGTRIGAALVLVVFIGLVEAFFFTTLQVLRARGETDGIAKVYPLIVMLLTYTPLRAAIYLSPPVDHRELVTAILGYGAFLYAMFFAA